MTRINDRTIGQTDGCRLAILANSEQEFPPERNVLEETAPDTAETLAAAADAAPATTLDAMTSLIPKFFTTSSSHSQETQPCFTATRAKPPMIATAMTAEPQ